MWRARSCRSGRAGAGTRGTATLGAASPLLRGLGAPHDRAGGYLRQDSASSRRNQGGGPRRIRASGSGEGKKAGESRSAAALRGEVSRLNRLEL